MAEKTLKTRIIQKHDTEANWLLATNFTPMNGEIIIYDEDDNYDYKRIKIGNGTDNVNDLDFVVNKEDIPTHSHDDVYYTESEIDSKLSTINSSITNITNGTTTVAKATSATKATQDGNGKTISSTYETKTDASNKLTEAKSYADTKTSAVQTNLDTTNETLSTLSDKVDLIEGYRLLGDYTGLREFQRGNINIFPEDCVWATKNFIEPTGKVSSYQNQNYICTETFIPVTAGYPHFLFYNGNLLSFLHFAYYDINKNLMSHTTTTTKLIMPPEGAHYIRFSLLVTSLGITAGQQAVDSNGQLTNPSGKIELYQQIGIAYQPGEYVTLEVFTKENFFIDGDLIDDESLSLSKCNFTTKYPCINCWDPEDVQSGYNGPANGYGQYGANDAYACTQPFTVSPGQKLSFWRLSSLVGSSATEIDARFVSFYDYSGTLITNLTYVKNVEVPENSVTAMVSLHLPNLNNDLRLGYIQRHEDFTKYQGYYEPLKDIYKINRNVISDLKSTEIHLYLPPEICVPSGTIVELYNKQCCLEADKYYLQWIGAYGDAYDWKYVLEGNDDLVGKSFVLTLNVYNEALEFIDTATTTVKFISNIINEDQLIIPIGDSLTNQKPWLNTIYSTLSNQKIKFRGTRGTTDPSLINGITHEGRSGAGANWYNLGTSTYAFDANGLSTLSDITTNPFWNTATNAFDFDYYCDKTADGGAGYFQDASGNAISLEPTGVMIFLGANGASLDPTASVNAITELVRLIRQSKKGVSLPIYVVNTQFRAPYILATTADGFATNSGGEFKFQNDLKYFRLMKALNNILIAEPNVYIVPIASTFDSEHNYPYTEVNINPYNDTIKMKKYTDTIHPQWATYSQMGATMFGTISGHLATYAEVSDPLGTGAYAGKFAYPQGLTWNELCKSNTNFYINTNDGKVYSADQQYPLYGYTTETSSNEVSSSDLVSKYLRYQYEI